MTSLHLGACGFSTIHHNRLSSENQEGTRYFESTDPKDLRIDRHTHLQTLALLSSMRIPVMGTDQDGTIAIPSDGKHGESDFQSGPHGDRLARSTKSKPVRKTVLLMCFYAQRVFAARPVKFIPA